MEKKAQVRGVKGFLRLVGCGFAMGAADLVPGVSGGTMAFITGVYGDLLASIKGVNGDVAKEAFSLRWKEVHRKVAWEFLLSLALGMALAVGCLAKLIVLWLNDEVARTYLFAGFFGLILGSVLFCLKRVEKWSPLSGVGLILGVVVAFSITSLPATSSFQGGYDVFVGDTLSEQTASLESISNYDSRTGMLKHVHGDVLAAMVAKGIVAPATKAFSHREGREGTVSAFVTSFHPPWFNPWLVGCGSIAICAMLLPGISGSYLLTVFGAYPIVIGAMADFVGGLKVLSWEMDPFLILANLGVGVLLGLALFSRLISWLMEHFHDMTMALLIGFMLGALKSVWPFWVYQKELLPLKLSKGVQLFPLQPHWPNWESSSLVIACAVALGGFALVVFCDRLASRLKKPSLS